MLKKYHSKPREGLLQTEGTNTRTEGNLIQIENIQDIHFKISFFLFL
jgi:hypothetical protein